MAPEEAPHRISYGVCGASPVLSPALKENNSQKLNMYETLALLKHNPGLDMGGGSALPSQFLRPWNAVWRGF